MSLPFALAIFWKTLCACLYLFWTSNHLGLSARNLKRNKRSVAYKWCNFQRITDPSTQTCSICSQSFNEVSEFSARKRATACLFDDEKVKAHSQNKENKGDKLDATQDDDQVSPIGEEVSDARENEIANSPGDMHHTARPYPVVWSSYLHCYMKAKWSSFLIRGRDILWVHHAGWSTACTSFPAKFTYRGHMNKWRSQDWRILAPHDRQWRLHMSAWSRTAGSTRHRWIQSPGQWPSSRICSKENGKL